MEALDEMVLEVTGGGVEKFATLGLGTAGGARHVRSELFGNLRAGMTELNERIKQLCEEGGYTFKPWNNATLGGYRYWPMSLVTRNHGGGDMATGATLEASSAWDAGGDIELRQLTEARVLWLRRTRLSRITWGC